jgi:VIT1/CCC1 family predicted Fe2+/Mn2+ transporter
MPGGSVGRVSAGVHRMCAVHIERHRTERIGWLRAAVLGANDGIVSTASLVVGVAAANSSRGGVLVAGLAGLVAGAMSMAAGEYVSVSSQADTERADLSRERRELEADPDLELQELQSIYESRGLDSDLARKVAEQLTAGDALAAHARDELEISIVHAARPVQAAFASAATFAAGAAVPLLTAVLVPPANIILIVSVASLVLLAALGGVAAAVGGANPVRGAVRVAFWGALAMAVTAGIGLLVGAVV